MEFYHSWDSFIGAKVEKSQNWELEKAIRDRSHLTQKIITDKNGHQRKVWVKTAAKPSIKTKVEASKEEPKTSKNLDELPSDIYSYDADTVETIKNTKFAMVTVSYINNYGDRKVSYYKVAVALPKNANPHFNTFQTVAQNEVYGSEGSGHFQINSVKLMSPKEFAKEHDVGLDVVANSAGSRGWYGHIIGETENDGTNIMQEYLSKDEIAKQQKSNFENLVLQPRIAEKTDSYLKYYADEIIRATNGLNSVMEHPEKYTKTTIENTAKEVNNAIGGYKAALYIKKHGGKGNIEDAKKWYSSYNFNSELPIEAKEYESK